MNYLVFIVQLFNICVVSILILGFILRNMSQTRTQINHFKFPKRTLHFEGVYIQGLKQIKNAFVTSEFNFY